MVLPQAEKSNGRKGKATKRKAGRKAKQEDRGLHDGLTSAKFPPSLPSFYNSTCTYTHMYSECVCVCVYIHICKYILEAEQGPQSAFYSPLAFLRRARNRQARPSQKRRVQRKRAKAKQAKVNDVRPAYIHTFVSTSCFFPGNTVILYLSSYTFTHTVHANSVSQ